MQEIKKLEDLPIAIVALPQDQKGLQIDPKPISSRQDLERVLFFTSQLYRKSYFEPSKDARAHKTCLSSTRAYGKMISRNRKFHTDELLILRAPPPLTMFLRGSVVDAARRSWTTRSHTGLSMSLICMSHGPFAAAAGTLTATILTPHSNQWISMWNRRQRTRIASVRIPVKMQSPEDWESRAPGCFEMRRSLGPFSKWWN